MLLAFWSPLYVSMAVSHFALESSLTHCKYSYFKCQKDVDLKKLCWCCRAASSSCHSGMKLHQRQRLDHVSWSQGKGKLQSPHKAA